MSHATARRASPSGSGDLVAHVSELVHRIAGIQLGERQRTMVESRLNKRMIELGIADEEGYLAHLAASPEEETSALVSLLTTHHTFFFREYAHFEFLENGGLEQLVAAARARGDNRIRIWSAACSRGQEVYSLSMWMAAHLPRLAPGFTYEILGTDVDPESVRIAANGVYPYREIQEVPLQFLSGNWAKGTGAIAEFVKAKPSIKAPCRFGVLNLIDIARAPAEAPFDLVFCRNVFIYFLPEQIRDITAGLLKRLRPGGFLMIGVSESLNGLGLPVQARGPSIYSPTTARAVARAPDPAPPLKVLCVDDSPTVLALLKQALRPEHGFEIVATACNGLEAASLMKLLKVDVVTLDIHMPGMDGLAYLEKHCRAGHPPVLMVSSVSRDDADTALKALRLGACDYVQKPSAAELPRVSEEIRLKLRCAWRNRRAPESPRRLELDQSIGGRRSIAAPERCLRLVVAGLPDRRRLEETLRECGAGPQPPLVILLPAMGEALDIAARAWSAELGRPVSTWKRGDALACGQVRVASVAESLPALRGHAPWRGVSVLIYGEVPADAAVALRAWTGAQVLVEDLGAGARTPRAEGWVSDVVPATSFGYMSNDFLGRGDGR